MDSDESDFYIGENSIMNQNQQIAEIGLNEDDNQEIECKIPSNCDLSETKIECKILKILKIAGQRRYPCFHIEINKKIYFYSIHGIRSDNKIVLRCTNLHVNNKARSKCGNLSFILASEFLQEIIKNTPKKSETSTMWTSIYLDYSDPRVYDMKNYDINSFEIGRGHNCTGRKLDFYMKKHNPHLVEKVNYKLIKIANHRKNPNFHFEIDGKIYFYGFRGIKADFKIVLFCTKMKENGKSRCMTSSSILPTEFLKEIIQKTPNQLKTDKYVFQFLDNSDPRVYDIKNYDINSLKICGGHKCAGTELEDYIKINTHDIPEKVNCKLVNILTNRRDHPNFHFEINGKLYFYGLRGIKADYRIVLYCNQKSCGNSASILPSEFLKQLIQNTPKYAKYSKFLDISDPRVYDTENYDLNSFEICGSHKCPGTDLDIYIKKMKKRDKKMKKPVKKN
jgi:hypothetical protein